MPLNIDYVEFCATDFDEIMLFYREVFGWKFQQWGDDYISFSNSGIEGGFRLCDERPPRGGSLVILYSDYLDQIEEKLSKNGATITEKHEFPGGRRFHFLDPQGNELGVWTKVPDPEN